MSRRLSAVVVASLLAPALVGAPSAVAAGSPAEAPAAPGRVSGVRVVEVVKPAETYEVTVGWQASTATSTYRVRASDAAGTVLDRATVTATTWRAEVTARAGEQVTIRVTPYDGPVRGTSTRLETVLPDRTPPRGAFSVSRAGRDVTLTWTRLVDDVSPRREIVRSVRWGDGTRRQPWPGGRSIAHRYAQPGAWHPTVRLVDGAGDVAVVAVGAVVIGDHSPPSGTFSASPTVGWATLTEVGLTQLSLQDDLSAPGDIVRSVVWGDDSSTPWPAGMPVGHVYDTEGVFTPAVRLVDEAGHHRLVEANPVTVARDGEAPSVRLWRPRVDRRSVSSWHAIEGRAVDTGAGTAVVRVRVVQRRDRGWFAYHPGEGHWTRAATRARAWHRARTAFILPTRTGRWLCSVRPLAQGLLVVRVSARDNVDNTSPLLVRRQRLTRP